MAVARLAVRAALLAFCWAATSLAETGDADAHYRRGVEMAREGHWEQARAEFHAALELRPHRRVLYNLAKVSLEMQDAQSAIGYLEQYVQMVDDSTPPDELEEVESTLATLRAAVQPASGPHSIPSGSEAVPAPAAKSTPEQQGSEVEPSGAAAEPRASESSPAPASSPSASSKRRVMTSETSAPSQTATPNGHSAPAGSSTLSSPPQAEAIFLGAGIGFVLAGAAVWVVGDVEHRRLNEERRELMDNDLPEALTAADWDLAMQRAKAIGSNEAGFRSNERLDMLAWSLAGVGTACLAVGFWMLFSSDEHGNETQGRSRVTLNPHGATLHW